VLWFNNLAPYSEDSFKEEIKSIAEIKVISGSLCVLILRILLLEEVVSKFINWHEALETGVHVAKLIVVAQTTEVFFIVIYRC
jgi:hypothetical protein